MADLVSQLFNLIKLQQTLIAVESPLQERLRFLSSLSKESAKENINCYLWILEDDQIYQLQIDGQNLNLEQVKEYKTNSFKAGREDYFQILRFWKTTPLQGILILEGIFPWISQSTGDPDFFLTCEWIKSALINLKFYNRNSNKIALLLGANASLSSDIAALIPTITQELPTVVEINTYLPAILPPNQNQSQINDIANAAVGMYLTDIETGVQTALVNNNIEMASFSAYKIDLLRRVYSIEFLQPPELAVGGLSLMQETFKKYKRLLTPTAKTYNLRLPKGVLLVGPPGTGKSYSAKACSQILGFPLIILEWSNFRSYGNEAEYKLKKLLGLVDRINRVILYLDDFDKGFAGDDDLSRRLAGMLLTWMQERCSEAVVIASANNLDYLPPELTRAGRFDDIFKVDLPNNGERHEIFKIHLGRFDQRFLNGDIFTREEWRRLLKETHRCVGAEIQNIVERAAANTFYAMFPTDVPLINQPPVLEITLSSLLEARQNINPLAIREADKVERMRNKASLQGLPSSPVDDSVYSNGNINIFS
ncbi:ATP-binding protein [aff. Roholtiella sp. LEGE 12411]|uniref:ATP-binding protein n=1 Tax=aff. Roholtiella sp. LEGE 12411 TaxID=1828822 RepID=UPI00187F5C4C|nr:ATP-binding protein [aff. Roholtiella sp. LEGE 12411]MBE9036596.1 ATP-binding protein [aff. Roholtiella sp. LEGE 12411]